MSDTCSTLEAAQRLGVSIQTVQRWVDQGQLKAWKTVGGHRRIETLSVDELLRARRVSQPQADAPRRDAEFSTVLVVDDDASDRELVTMLVNAVLPNATVTSVSSGFEALLAIGQITPDVLITDVMMPHMNGFEMLNHLEAATQVRPRLILATSSYSLSELKAFGQLPPGVHFQGKPLDAVALAHLLRGAAEAADTLRDAPAADALPLP